MDTTEAERQAYKYFVAKVEGWATEGEIEVDMLGIPAPLRAQIADYLNANELELSRKYRNKVKDLADFLGDHQITLQQVDDFLHDHKVREVQSWHDISVKHGTFYDPEHTKPFPKAQITLADVNKQCKDFHRQFWQYKAE